MANTVGGEPSQTRTHASTAVSRQSQHASHSTQVTAAGATTAVVGPMHTGVLSVLRCVCVCVLQWWWAASPPHPWVRVRAQPQWDCARPWARTSTKRCAALAVTCGSRFATAGGLQFGIAASSAGSVPAPAAGVQDTSAAHRTAAHRTDLSPARATAGCPLVAVTTVGC